MSLLDRAKRAARAAYVSLERDKDGLPTPEEALSHSLSDLHDKLSDYDRCRRQNAAYYELIDSLCKQRDIWKDMFQKQSVENAAAQAYLFGQLEKAGKLVATVVALINEERAAAKKPLLVVEQKLDTGHVVKKRFEELLADLNKSAPADIDGPAERDKLEKTFADGNNPRLESGPVRFEFDKLFEKDVARSDGSTIPSGPVVPLK